MIPSSFHGIFSSLNQERSSAAATAPKESLRIVDQSEAQQEIEEAPKKSGQISVDVYEHDTYIIVRAPIAGVKLADLDIEVDGKVITIRGRRSLNDNLSKDQYYVQECFWGEFSRSITMPTIIDPKKIRATFSKDCILKIIVPKEEKVKIVRINESG
ncbi:Hsp20/alpha crystallin family protein [Candidatus Peregrinibacteria bacterium]|jgi:HSP20 family protein|nr:Hsp20/alpha crystallin family protein [Candidatus Peregrinibacteria bacterium]MBT3598534.1 Hsp20/alpha crystallin family protein [Candidatus Peregrinibacteria bacterium]MBT4585934.1 Hsp20/alpha crystallin family protein [Candidatus Peregrinibacteria bacterium]MBT6730498.1 Hsp20/alpha crystallin family protein [Candidatus Peregrinibacteria bacterium]MBT7009402.1 Hsp20/alpha crystallin family protein [Candidatus Peregrinibacteria bacterium]